jgi:hypothetical protein
MNKIIINQYLHKLNENKIEDITSKYNKIVNNNHEMRALLYTSQNNAVYYEWIIKRFLEEKNNYDDSSGLNEFVVILNDYFSKFLKLKQSNKLKVKDIQEIKTFDELKNIINIYYNYGKILTDKNIKRIEYNDYWMSFIPKNFEGSKNNGWIKWCTVYHEPDWDKHFVEPGNLLYLIHKFDPKYNIAIEQITNTKYIIWNWQDESYDAYSIQEIEKYIENNINDGHLNVSKIIKNVPKIKNKIFAEHWSDKLWDLYNVGAIHTDSVERRYGINLDDENLDEDELKNMLSVETLKNIVMDYS